MSDSIPQPPDSRYRLIGTRRDGSRATVLGAMTNEEARSAMIAISEAGIFANVEIAVDSGDDLLLD